MAETSVQIGDLEACEIADKFISQYYEAFDKKRNLVGKMYNDAACMVWNGHALTGQQNIASFIEALPVSEHKLKSLDAQPISNAVTQGQSTVLLNAAGNVKYDNMLRCFTQTFIITRIAGYWKIASDRLRFID